jgi:hypothetical protein
MRNFRHKKVNASIALTGIVALLDAISLPYIVNESGNIALAQSAPDTVEPEAKLSKEKKTPLRSASHRPPIR